MTQKTLDTMFTPAFGEYGPSLNYGYGWYVSKQFNRRAISPWWAAGQELDKIVTAWIRAFQVERGSAEYEANWWAISEVLEWAVEDKADRLWPFILEAFT